MAWISRLAHRYLRIKQDYRQVFSGPAGEAVLNDILRAAQVGLDPTVPESAIQTGVNIGRQLVGQHVLNTLNMPDSEIVRRANQVSGEEKESDYGGTEESL